MLKCPNASQLPILSILLTDPSHPSSVISRKTSLDLTWVVVAIGVCLAAIIIITLVLHALLTGRYQVQARSIVFTVDIL